MQPVRDHSLPGLRSSISRMYSSMRWSRDSEKLRSTRSGIVDPPENNPSRDSRCRRAHCEAILAFCSQCGGGATEPRFHFSKTSVDLPAISSRSRVSTRSKKVSRVSKRSFRDGRRSTERWRYGHRVRVWQRLFLGEHRGNPRGQAFGHSRGQADWKVEGPMMRALSALPVARRATPRGGLRGP